MNGRKRTNNMQEYEIMYIVPTSFTEDELGTIEKTVAALIEKNGASIKKSTRLGKMRFAYDIKHQQYGHYVLLRVMSEPQSIAAIDNGLRLNQKEILRHIVVRGEDAKEEFNLVQFQPIQVDGSARRAKRIEKEKAAADSEKEEKEQKEAVAVIEEDKEKKEDAPKEKLEELSAEDLEKKIDAALEEEAK